MVNWLALGCVGLVVAGCSKKEAAGLPAEIQYGITLIGAKEGSSHKSLDSIVGMDFVVGGKPRAKVVKNDSNWMMRAGWLSPKADINEIVLGPHVIAGSGGCGPFEVALGPPPKAYQGLKDDQLARFLQHKNELDFTFFDIVPPPSVRVYVDRGASTSTVTVGAVSVGKDNEAGLEIVTAGCTGPLPVLVDGKQIGVLDAAAPVHLITLEPGICHRFQRVGYGSYESSAPEHLPANAITSLSDMPIHFLKAASDSIEVGGGGTVTTELVRVACVP